jgi:exodeoxyribonuclease III
VHKKGAWSEFLKQDPDIFCLQETKAEESQLPEEVRNVSGYESFFSSSQTKKGYSGVAVYTKHVPKKVEYGMGTKKFDEEGRLLSLYFDQFVLFCVYFPNGGGGPERLQYKLDFYDSFLKHILMLRKKGLGVVFCGDVNTAHEEIDLARPKENEKNTGFLPEEREWIDEVLRAGFSDTFRTLHPNKKSAYSYWDMKTRARDRNVGWRIDYFFASNDLQKKIKKADILPDIFGSDHCPVELVMDILK